MTIEELCEWAEFHRDYSLTRDNRYYVRWCEDIQVLIWVGGRVEHTLQKNGWLTEAFCRDFIFVHVCNHPHAVIH